MKELLRLPSYQGGREHLQDYVSRFTHQALPTYAPPLSRSTPLYNNPSSVATASWRVVKTFRRASCALSNSACLAFRASTYFARAALISAFGAFASMAF